MKLWTWVSVVAVTFGLAGCISPPGTADANLLHRMDTVMRQASPSMSVRVRLSADQVKTGDAILAEITSNATGFIYLFQIGTEGRTLSLVFPNAMDGANYIAAGTSMRLPRQNWRMTARGPEGVGHMMAVVTKNPLDLMALQSNTRLGKIEVRSQYGAAMVTLRETTP